MNIMLQADTPSVAQENLADVVPVEKKLIYYRIANQRRISRSDYNDCTFIMFCSLLPVF
jgi:hypothetical protein